MAVQAIFRRARILCPPQLNPFSLTNRYHGRWLFLKLKMRSVYFNNETGTDKLVIRMLYDNPELNVNKELMFERTLSETTEKFLDRLVGRLSDIHSRKAKKKKGKAAESPAADPEPLPDIQACFLVNDQPQNRQTTFCDMMTPCREGNLKLKIVNDDYSVLLNCPIIYELALPERMVVGCPVVPDSVKMTWTNLAMSKFQWFKRLPTDNQWTECATGYSFTPDTSHLGYLLKLSCTPANESQTGPTCEISSSNTVEQSDTSQLIEKRLEVHKRDELELNDIRVVTYNILADVYATTKESKTILFTYCKPETMAFANRVRLILKELSGYNGDLICLQEVDKKFFDTKLSAFMNTKGYNGTYAEKQGTREGCAFFYRENKFRLVETSEHVFKKELTENELLRDLLGQVGGNSNLMKRFTEIHTKMQILVLECLRRPNEMIVLGNTHLYFHPDADHIRLLQGIMAFKLLQRKIQEVKEKNPDKHVSLIFCGDLNSTPDCGIYKFMTTGSVSSSEVDWKSCKDEEIEGVSFSHTLPMASAYGAPKHTNYTATFKECLDYIYYQTDRLTLKSILPIPDESDLSRETALPSTYYPSDHVALIATLKWKS